jgi:adenylate cyclase
MADGTQSRKLATIVALDVAGYSARTEADEAKTTAEVAALRSVIEGIAGAHGGRVFNTAGDGFMLEFGSSLSAVEAAFTLAEQCEPKVRVGVHLGDVVVQPNGDLLGHGVNVAARLMARSDPGSVLVSGAVRQTILVEFWLATGKWPDCVDEVPYEFKAECEKARHIPIEEFGF